MKNFKTNVFARILFIAACFANPLFSQSSGEEQAALGIARGAAASCLNDYRGNNWIINESATPSVACDYINRPPRTGYRVIFSVQPADCGGNPCDPIIVAEVEISCDKHVISSTCY
jgi:hypothetical protein